ncbi:MAG: DMT family transporter, partial [Caulobacterales bacterium]|nr:DMT family transporter [Caulobacterales bacterium]
MVTRSLAMAAALGALSPLAAYAQQALPTPIETQTLRELDAWSVSALSRAEGALAPDLWSRTDPAFLALAFERLPAVYESPAMQTLARRVLLSGGCAMTGTGLLIGIQANPMPHANALVGVLLALLAAVGYAAMVLCSRRLAGRYHPLQSVTISFIAGALFLLPCTLVTGWVSSYSALGWTFLLYLGAVPTALAYCLYFRGMRHTSATVAGIATLL